MYISKLESDIDLEKIYNPPVRDKNDIFSSYNLEHRFYLIALINSLLLGLFFSFLLYHCDGLIISPFWRSYLWIHT